MYEEKISNPINIKETPRDKAVVDDKPPVISTYNQIKFDLYKLFQDYSVAYGGYKALEYDNRHGSKEAKTYAQMMTSYSLQFYGLVSNGWVDTKKRIKQEEVSLRGEDFVTKHGGIFDVYDVLMQRLMGGGRFKDSAIKKSDRRMRLDADNFALCYQVISRFIFFSGIGDIEGRFLEEKNDFGYGG